LENANPFKNSVKLANLGSNQSPAMTYMDNFLAFGWVD